MGATGLAVDFLMKVLDHIQPDSGTRLQKGQQAGLQCNGQITYFLKAEQGHKRLSRDFAVKVPDHIHA
jgi:hypothetical protein